MEVIMFEISFSEFTNNNFYSDYSISYMTGFTVADTHNSKARVIVNVDSKTAFAYMDK